MRTSQAARYARWSALLAFALAGVSGAIYVQRKWQARVERRAAPPAPPREVERQSSGLTFSKGDGNRIIFTVQASKSTDFKGQDASLLEDVRITVFGKTGERHDVIHTRSCRYAKTDGSVQCGGEVEMELQSREDAERAAKNPSAVPNIVRVQTSGVTFENASGRAQTVQPVKFDFPNGSGEGIGAVYQTQSGELRLVRDVHLKLHGIAAGKAKAGGEAPQEVQVEGSSLEFGKLTRRILLTGPVTARTATQQLTAGEMTLELDKEFRADALTALPGPQKQVPSLTALSPQDPSKLVADKLTAEFAPQGWIREIQADGNVQGSSASGELKADSGLVEMWPKVNQARLMTARGHVQLDGREGKQGTTRHLQTGALQANFAGGEAGRANQMQHAETLERGTLSWSDAAGARTKLEGDKLSLSFGGRGKAQQMLASGAVRTEREIKGHPLQTASATNGVVDMDAAGEWSRITLMGNVHLKEGERSGESQQAMFQRAEQLAVLTGQATARDESSVTHATKITFRQANGDIEAEGSVRSTDLSAKANTIHLDPAPTNLSSDRMTANSKTGRAVYSGHARMWQGASVVEAETIELLRATRELHANGNVQAVMPQVSEGGAGKPPTLWHISSATLAYWDAENKAHLEKNVVVQSTDQRMRAAALDLFLTRAEGGAAQINRAVGTGGVMVEAGDRRATAERGVYTAADQKFVLSGGVPTLYDALEGTTTGRELTFHIADDTIIVDSEAGKRTLTKHRVQKQ